jgi:hypothetical protein
MEEISPGRGYLTNGGTDADGAPVVYLDAGWIDDDGLLDVGPALRAGDDCSMLDLDVDEVRAFGVIDPVRYYQRRTITFNTDDPGVRHHLGAVFGDEALDRMNAAVDTVPRHMLTFDGAAGDDDLVLVQISPGHVTINDRELGPMVVRMRVTADQFLANLRKLVTADRRCSGLARMHAAYRQRRGRRRFRR